MQPMLVVKKEIDDLHENDDKGQVQNMELDEQIVKEETCIKSCAEVLQNEDILSVSVKQEVEHSNSKDQRSNGATGPRTKAKTKRCKLCDQVFTAGAMAGHYLTHSGAKPFKCKVCQKTFRLKGQLSAHMFSHTHEKRFQCNQCGSEFSLPATLRRHTAVHSKDMNLTCECCDYRCYKKHTLQKHRLKHEDEKWERCELCNKPFRNKTHLAHHVNKHQTHKDIPCSVCFLRFTTEADLNQHKIMEHRMGTFQECQTCDFKASCMKIFKMHMEFKHESNEPNHRYKCYFCEYSGMQDERLISHIRIMHNGVCTIKCDSCDKKFITASRMEAHKKQYHEETEHRCTRCLKYYHSNRYLISHLENCRGNVCESEDEKVSLHSLYTCEMCDYTCKKEDGLNNHVMFHHGGANAFECEVCKQRFLTQYKQDRHMRRYHDESGHQCVMCHKYYSTKQSLHKHHKVCPEK